MERVVDPGDRPGMLRVGAAEERLEALLEEEREARAASVPARTAAVRRLAVASPAQGGPTTTTSSSARRSGSEPEGPGRGRERETGQVTIEAAPGLLDSVRQSLEVLQRAFGGTPQNQGLLGPLRDHHDLGHLAGSVSNVHGGHGSIVVSRPISYGPRMESGPQPRVLDPYAMTTPPQARGEEINPFWSTQAGSAQPGVDLNRTRYLQAMFGAHLEVEAIREKVLKEAETLFAKEIKKITRGGESSSFESVPSAGREQGKPRVEVSRSGIGLDGQGHPLPHDQGGPQLHGLECPPGLQGGGTSQGPSTRTEATGAR